LYQKVYMEQLEAGSVVALISWYKQMGKMDESEK
jgi:hypothetical protein